MFSNIRIINMVVTSYNDAAELCVFVPMPQAIMCVAFLLLSVCIIVEKQIREIDSRNNIYN